jgi:hypothetical protein
MFLLSFTRAKTTIIQDEPKILKIFRSFISKECEDFQVSGFMNGVEC